MKPSLRFRQPVLIILLSFLGSSLGFSAEFEVLRPSKLNMPAQIRKVFIDPTLINDANDKLELKSQTVRRLRERLNETGRFEVFLGPPRDFDPNIETVAVIQGDIISGGEIDEGQFTEKATCRGAISGLIGALSARERTQQGITVSRRRMACKHSDLQTELLEQGIAKGLGLLGVKEFPRVDEAIRIYKYKNFSLFAQVNLSLTQIGLERETLAIRAEAASFSRHVINPQSYRNVRESGDSALIIWAWFHFTPVAPVILREIGIVSASNPGSAMAKWYTRATPSAADIPPDERYQIISGLVDKTLTEFIGTISPYKERITVEVASGGNAKARSSLEAGNYKEAQEILKNPSAPADLYNLGLTYELGATTPQDFEDALYYYDQAFEKSPDKKLYAQGIGRMEFQLKSANRNLSNGRN